MYYAPERLQEVEHSLRIADCEKCSVCGWWMNNEFLTKKEDKLICNECNK